MLALRYARPANLSSVSADKVLQCRADLAEELAVFRDYVATQRAELAELASVPIKRRRLEAFAEHVEHTVETPLRTLEKGLALLRLEPTRSLLLVGSFVPPAARYCRWCDPADGGHDGGRDGGHRQRVVASQPCPRSSQGQLAGELPARCA
jgi:hypothetical protein